MRLQQTLRFQRFFLPLYLSNADKEVIVAQEKEIEKDKSDCISKMNSTSLKYITDQKAEIDDIWKNCLAKKLK